MKELLAKANAKDVEITSLKTKISYEKQQKEEEMFELKDYIDHLEDLEFVPKQINLPCVYIKNDDNYQLMIDADELNSLKSVQDLISRLNEKLN